MAQVSCPHRKYGEVQCVCKGDKAYCQRCANPFERNRPTGVLCGNCGGNINKKVMVRV